MRAPKAKSLKNYQENELIALLELEEMERCRNSLLGFTLWTKDDYIPNWHHRVLCHKLDAFARGEIKRLMVFMPPRHGKSELVSRRLPAYLLGRNPDLQIIGASYSDALATRMNRDIQRIIEHPYYAALFPGTRLNSSNVRTAVQGIALKNSDMFEIVGRRGSYVSAGVCSGISGMGMNVGIIDDPIKDQADADSPTKRQSIEEWYNSTFYTRLEKDAQILLTVTRWHEDDLAGRLLKRARTDPDADQWEVVNYPAIRENDRDITDPRAIGEVLWPDKYDLRRLNKVRATVGSRVWNALYQQHPSALEGNIVKRPWIRRYSVRPTKFDEGCITLDATFTKKATSDKVAIQAWGRIGSGKYIVDQTFGRMGITETIDNFCKMIQRWPYFTARVVENKANGPAIEELLRKNISGLILWEPQGDKVARVNACAPQFEAGNVYFPADELAAWADPLIDNLCTFPNAEDDDRVDATTMALLRLERSVSSGVGSIRVIVS